MGGIRGQEAAGEHRIRIATHADLDGLVEVIALAFLGDPAWGWVFADESSRLADFRRWWGLFVESGLRYPNTWISGDMAAVALWIPPGGTELTHDEEESIEVLLGELIGTHRVPDAMASLDSFERARPREEPHYYLSLLATHPDHRGQGVGMDLLRANLAQVDQEHLPAYLESTNPANDKRYTSVGFAAIGSFQMTQDGPTVTAMWRDAR